MDEIERRLVDAGYHTESVQRITDHHRRMIFSLSTRDFSAVSAHVGAFCENTVNLLSIEAGEEPQEEVDFGTTIDQLLSGNIGTVLPRELRLTIPRQLRAAYELRSTRDGLHVNLAVAKNHVDARTAVRTCSWVLAELVRIAGEEQDMEEVASIVEALSRPILPIVHVENGHRMVLDADLELREEILLHLEFESGESISVAQLSEWIPGAKKSAIFAHLRHLHDDRLVLYKKASKSASNTPLGSREAERIIEGEVRGTE